MLVWWVNTEERGETSVQRGNWLAHKLAGEEGKVSQEGATLGNAAPADKPRQLRNCQKGGGEGPINLFGTGN